MALSLVMGFGVAASLASCREVREDKGELTLPDYENIEVPDASTVNTFVMRVPLKRRAVSSAIRFKNTVSTR